MQIANETILIITAIASVIFIVTSFIVNLFIDSFKKRIMFGLNKTFSNNDTILLIVSFVLGIFLGLIMPEAIINKFDLLVKTSVFMGCIVAIVLIVIQRNDKEMIDLLGNSKFIKHTKNSNLKIMLLIIWGGVLSSLGIMDYLNNKVSDENQITVALILMVLVYILSIIIASLYKTFVQCVNYNRKNVLLEDESEITECFVIGFDKDFVVIIDKHKEEIQYVKISHVKYIKGNIA
ncbi:hypothetical protein [Desulfuribacillus alkaliarsenatis]|uniref:Uncharacterized protein n=1 Tax=Desulfuribacillus alkaliarsenatis TaxID=766136 RepID=A0A1E5G0K9_9FIRM|nr:hypothetical protein [Desulfuribacillus alkaliarsenatis]OEF96362.1 hypothetical protein BHF68_09435 [Desulfuribacillus alkaliarsenatis]